MDALVVEGDASHTETVVKLAESISERYGRLDVLVNNVGHFVTRPTPFEQLTDDQLDDIYRMNLKHVFLVTRTMLPLLRQANGPSSIVTVSSIEGFRGIPGFVPYGAFKAAITGFTISLALELGPEGIRVNAVAPETTDSAQVPLERMIHESQRHNIPRWIPLGRFGRPADSAGCVVFLASELAGWVTGTVDPCRWGSAGGGGLVSRRPRHLDEHAGHQGQQRAARRSKRRNGMSILVVGGAGVIGGDAALHFRSAGEEVTIAGRKQPHAGPMTAFPFITLDYIANDVAASALGRFETLVFAAGNDVRHQPKGSGDEHWQRANSQGVPRFAAAAKSAGVTTFINVGSYYPQAAPHLVDADPYIRSRRDADDGVRALNDGAFRAISVNAPVVVGPLPGVPSRPLRACVGYAEGRLDLPIFAPPGSTNYITTTSLTQAIDGAIKRGVGGTPSTWSATRTGPTSNISAHSSRRSASRRPR